jgi:lambda repressor-like predicted transcriptional regulator
MADTLIPNEPNCEEHASPQEIAKFLSAFVECSPEIQDVVLEMVTIISDNDSDYDEKQLAADAMMQALFPGTSADVLEMYRQRLSSPEAEKAAAALRAEEQSFADRVRALMKEKNVTQETLAESAGITQPAVSNILNRRCRPQRRTVARFAEALGVSVVELWPEYVDG